MSVDAPTERDIFLIAKKELKPFLAVVVGAFLTLPTLIFVSGLEPTYIRLFGELSEDNGWQHLFLKLAAFLLHNLFFWMMFRGVFGEDDGFDELVTLGINGLLFGYIHVSPYSKFAFDRMTWTPRHFRGYIFAVLICADRISLNVKKYWKKVNRRDAVNGSVHE